VLKDCAVPTYYNWFVDAIETRTPEMSRVDADSYAVDHIRQATYDVGYVLEARAYASSRPGTQFESDSGVRVSVERKSDSLTDAHYAAFIS
jgi:hypothetical protein